MTNFSDLSFRDEVSSQLARDVRGGFTPSGALPAASTLDTTVDDPWWKDTLHGLGKWEARTRH